MLNDKIYLVWAIFLIVIGGSLKIGIAAVDFVPIKFFIDGGGGGGPVRFNPDNKRGGGGGGGVGGGAGAPDVFVEIATDTIGVLSGDSLIIGVESVLRRSVIEFAEARWANRKPSKILKNLLNWTYTIFKSKNFVIIAWKKNKRISPRKKEKIFFRIFKFFPCQNQCFSKSNFLNLIWLWFNIIKKNPVKNLTCFISQI